MSSYDKPEYRTGGEMKFILFSDLHLDASFTGLGRDGVAAERRRQALRTTLRHIIDLAKEVHADAVLCGGDLYEHEHVTDDTQNVLQERFGELDPMPVYLAPGNHDWYSNTSVYERAAWTPNVHVFKGARLEPVIVGDGITLWGAAHRAPAGTTCFLDDFRAQGPGVHLALFHGSERGWFDEQRDGKNPHAPFDERQIAGSGLHHVFLGHFHRAKAAPSHTYPGNPCPLTFGEDPGRGAVVVTVTPDGQVSRDWQSVAAYQVHDIVVDVTGCTSREGIRSLVAAKVQGQTGSARVALIGELHADVDLSLGDLAYERGTLDALVLHADELRIAYDVERLSQEQTVQGQFVRDVRAADLDPETRQRVLVTGLRALHGRKDLEVV